MYWTGQILMWTGFFGAAFSSVCRLEVAGDKWSTIPWAYYLAAMSVAVAGVALLRISAARKRSDVGQNEADYLALQSSLNALTERTAKLARAPLENPAEIARQIDEQLAGPFSDFADARQALIQRHGLQVFAAVMTDFATAERYVNRSWSAAADGYLNEAQRSLEIADRRLQAAAETLRAAAKSAK